MRVGVVRGREGGEGGGEVWSDLPQIRRWWVEVRSVVAMGHVRANCTGVVDTAAPHGPWSVLGVGARATAA